ncbi:MAG: TIGR03984 family CRISPR-associated protein [Ignavibacteriae bacterium]|nr:MAG: TIGR03984 family CRISPR-associated protein [Ignavibacteriota bacterium]
MEYNGLNLTTKKSEAKAIKVANLEDIKKEFGNNETGYFITYLDYKVIIGKYESGKFINYDNEQLDLKYIQKMRIFNKNKELLVWRTDGKWKGRVRTDEEGEECDIVVADQVLFGTRATKCAGYSTLEDSRGTNLKLPFEFEINEYKSIEDRKKRIKIKTHNYIDYNENNQAEYVDCRFVEFVDENNKILK